MYSFDGKVAWQTDALTICIQLFSRNDRTTKGFLELYLKVSYRIDKNKNKFIL